MNDCKTGGDFRDPLDNYEPKTYDDPLEQAICELPASDVQHEPYTTISPDDSVKTALNKLAEDHIACLLVVQSGKLVGVFTNREVLDKVALEDDILERPVRDVMVREPVCVRNDDPIAATLCVMAVHGYRHVPILNANDEIDGIVSPQRVTNFLTTHVDGNS